VSAGYLLDVNLLLALVRQDHTNHRSAKTWFERAGAQNWATCANDGGQFRADCFQPKIPGASPRT
jgi:hypothetical protein